MSTTDSTRRIEDDDTMVGLATGPEPDAAPTEGAPERIGRYLVVHELGRGGMGIVFAAYDPELDRKVAIKLVRRGFETDTARMMREAQAMARLSHANVVTVFDVGTYRGQVFIAMDFVDGSTLREWVEAEPRSWREVVQRFLEAGRGLAAAHAAELIHRDFKPDNVLVPRLGEAKVLDFGIAKAAGEIEGDNLEVGREGDETEAEPPEDDGQMMRSSTGALLRRSTGAGMLSTPLTEAGAMVGTPAYMSPEQHTSRPTDARTDQFSFAVSMWEALYGQRPFGGSSAATVAFNKRKGRIKALPADAKVPRHLNRALMRALSAKPENRYPDMETLLADLGRDPQAAWRRRLALGVGVLAIGAVGFGIAMANAGPDQCEPATQLEGVWDDQRRAAVQETFAASGLDYAPRASARVTELLDEYTARWSHLFRDTCEASRRQDRDATESYLRLACLEDRREGLDALVDLLADADRDVIERSVQAATSLESLATCTDPGAVRRLANLAQPPDAERERVDELRGQLARIQVLSLGGRADEALEIATQVDAEADALAYRPLRAEARLAYAKAIYATGNLKGAEPVLADALWLAHAAGHDVVAIDAQIRFARLLTNRGGLAQARWELRRTEATLARIGDDPLLEADLERAHGILDAEDSRDAEAKAHFERALRLLEGAGADALEIAAAHNSLSSACKQLGEYDAAEVHGLRSLEMFEAELGKDHPAVGSPLHQLGRTYRAQKRFDDAIEVYQRAIDVRVRAQGADHPAIGSHLNNLGNVYSELERYDEAEKAYRESLRIREVTLGTDSVRLAYPLQNLADVLRKAGRPADGLPLLERALELRTKAHGERHVKVADVLMSRGQARMDLGETDEGLADLREALAMAEEAGETGVGIALPRLVLARALATMPDGKSEAGTLARLAMEPLEVDGEKDLAEEARELSKLAPPAEPE